MSLDLFIFRAVLLIESVWRSVGGCDTNHLGFNELLSLEVGWESLLKKRRKTKKRSESLGSHDDDDIGLFFWFLFLLFYFSFWHVGKFFMSFS